MDIRYICIATIFAIVSSVVHNSCAERTFEIEEFDDDDLSACTNNTALEDYTRQTLLNFRGSMKMNIPTLSIPKLDPLRMKDRKITSTLPDGIVNTEFKNILVRGLSNFTIQLIHVDQFSPVMEMSLSFKVLYITGHYAMNGIIREGVPVRNHGRFHVDASDVVMMGKGKLSRDQYEHVVITRITLDMDFTDFKVFFDTLMSGSDMGKYFKDTLNTYGRQLFDMTKPALLQKLQAAFQRHINTQMKEIKIPALESFEQGSNERYITAPTLTNVIKKAPFGTSRFQMGATLHIMVPNFKHFEMEPKCEI